MTTELLPADDLDQRVAALRTSMTERGLAAVVVASPECIYYLTGFDHLGYFAFTVLVVPAEGAPVIVTREMERPTVRAQLPHCRHRTFEDGTDPATAVAAALAELVHPGSTIGIEDGAMFFPPAIRARITATVAARWVDVDDLLAPSMAVKSATEIASMCRAAEFSDAGMAAAIAAARPGASEYHVAADVHHAMYANGGQQPGFVPLIRPLSMLDQEHVTWGERQLERGGGLFVELSGCFRRYHAPQSRTIYIGRPPADAHAAHAAALTGLHTAREALRPGVTSGDVYATWQRSVAGTDAAIWPLRHHCGYLVGIGFPPSWVGGGQVQGLRPDGDLPIVAGMTFHLMSWVAGHVVSDTALVTPHGAELLTTSTHDLLVVD